MDGVIKTEKNRDIDNYWILLEPLFADVLQQVLEDRRREGASTADDISRQIGFLESRVGEIETLAPAMEEQINRSLREKFADLLEGQADESRILSEIAVQLVRFDINEEIVRLKTHFGNFRDVSAHDDEPIGKKLDFLCQEINREINTIGSKSTLVEINQYVVEMKDSLEKSGSSCVMSNSKPFRIAISGKSGCGNSTVTGLLSKRLQIKMINYTFHNIAEDQGIEFRELCRMAEEDPKWDYFVDENQVKLAMEDSSVLGSRPCHLDVEGSGPEGFPNSFA